MSKSAVIKIDKTPLCIYTKWYGTFVDVVAYANYAKLRDFGTPEVDPSGITSLIQVMTNCSGGGFGLEVMPYEDSKKYETDNGTYILEDWDVIDIEGHRGSEHSMSDDLIERLIQIDACQPKPLQLGAEFIRDVTSRKATFAGELAVGDVIWDRGEGVAPVHATIVGFGDSGYPYVHVDNDASSSTGRPAVPDHYAREHFGKFLGNPTWFIRIPELSHPQATAAAFRGRPADQNAAGQSNLQASIVEAAEVHFENPSIFGDYDDEQDGGYQEPSLAGETQPVGMLEDIDEPDDVDMSMLGGLFSDATDEEPDDTDATWQAPYQVGTWEQADEPEQADSVADADSQSLFEDDDEDDYGSDDFSNTDLLQMVTDLGDEEDDASITNNLVIPSDAMSSSDLMQYDEPEIADVIDEGEETGSIVMTSAGSDTEQVKIIQPLPQDDTSIDAVTMHVNNDSGRSVFIPLEPYEIEPDFSTSEIAKNPRPYPDVLDANFKPYDGK